MQLSSARFLCTSTVKLQPKLTAQIKGPSLQVVTAKTLVSTRSHLHAFRCLTEWESHGVGIKPYQGGKKKESAGANNHSENKLDDLIPA